MTTALPVIHRSYFFFTANFSEFHHPCALAHLYIGWNAHASNGHVAHTANISLRRKRHFVHVWTNWNATISDIPYISYHNAEFRGMNANVERCTLCMTIRHEKHHWSKLNKNEYKMNFISISIHAQWVILVLQNWRAQQVNILQSR